MKKDIQELLRLYKEKSFDYAIENFADKLNQQEHFYKWLYDQFMKMGKLTSE